MSGDGAVLELDRFRGQEYSLPRARLQAFYERCGRPVILGVEGQAQKILEEAQAGICIEPENSSQLAEAVSRLAQDALLREALGRNGRCHVVQHFSRSRTARIYLEVLNRILGRENADAVAA